MEWGASAMPTRSTWSSSRPRSHPSPPRRAVRQVPQPLRADGGSATYHGTGELGMRFDPSIQFTDASGQTYDPGGAHASANALDSPFLTDGQSVTYPLVFTIPADRVGGGTFTATRLMDMSGQPPIVFAAA